MKTIALFFLFPLVAFSAPEIITIQRTTNGTLPYVAVSNLSPTVTNHLITSWYLSQTTGTLFSVVTGSSAVAFLHTTNYIKGETNTINLKIDGLSNSVVVATNDLQGQILSQSNRIDGVSNYVIGITNNFQDQILSQSNRVNGVSNYVVSITNEYVRTNHTLTINETIGNFDSNLAYTIPIGALVGTTNYIDAGNLANSNHTIGVSNFVDNTLLNWTNNTHIHLSSRYLITAGGLAALRWNDRTMHDAGNWTSIDWGARQLIGIRIPGDVRWTLDLDPIDRNDIANLYSVTSNIASLSNYLAGVDTTLDNKINGVSNYVISVTNILDSKINGVSNYVIVVTNELHNKINGVSNFVIQSTNTLRNELTNSFTTETLVVTNNIILANNGALRIKEAGTGNELVTLQKASDNVVRTYTTVRYDVINAGTPSKTNASFDIANERTTLLGPLRIGGIHVGTISESSELQIQGVNRPTIVLGVNGADKGTNGIVFSHNGGVGNYYSRKKNGIFSRYNGTGWSRGDLHFVLNNEGNTNNYDFFPDTRMIIRSSGDTCIGDTNTVSGSKLTVSGDTTIKGNLTITNMIYGDRSLLTFGKTSGGKTDFYGGYAALTGSTNASIIAIRDGSVIGMSSRFNVTAQTTAGDLWCEVWIEDTVALSNKVAISGTGWYNCIATTNRNVYPFTAGKPLIIYHRFVGFAGSIGAVFDSIEVVNDN